MSTLYHDLIAAGIPIDNHESDLYFAHTPVSLAILANYPESEKIAKSFVNQVKGGLWVDVPFAFLPWWEARHKNG